MSTHKKVESKINVRVAVRVRPINDGEKAEGAKSIVKLDDKKLTVTCKNKIFSSFDKVYGPNTTQERIYADMVSSQVERVLAGYNCTLFAYGQTGTGKTYTMEGGSGKYDSYQEDPTTGIIPRAVEHIFEELAKSSTEEYSVRISYLELYNEELYDLLAPTSDDRERLRIFDDPSKKGVVVISGAEEIPVRDRAEVYRLLKRGAEKRTTAATLMNMNSSRSHSIFTVSVVIRENTASGEELVKQGKLNLVDLAGSEHIGRSGAEGKRAKEAGNINQSLLTLGRVITALTSSAPHVPYRESKLTRLLQDSLGGATITSIIATLSPASTNYEETISTLEYAARAKSIKNHPECNQKVSRKALFKEYNDEIERLRRDLRTAREKNGIFLSQESYEGMEKEIAAKTEQLNELEGQLDAAIGRLQKFIEDQEIMDEQYRELYHRNKRLELKLQQRVDELDDVKKNLAVTTDRFNATKDAFDDIHKVAKKLSKELRMTREVVYDQQLEIQDWWNKEESLLDLISQNRELVEAIHEKVKPEVTDCCALLTAYSKACKENRDRYSEERERNDSKMSDHLENSKSCVSKADELQQRKLLESEKLTQTYIHQIIALSNESESNVREKMTSQVFGLQALAKTVLLFFENMMNEAKSLSEVFKELRKSSEFMLEQRRKIIEEDRCKRLNAINALRVQREKTSEINALARAIIEKCSEHESAIMEITDNMESDAQENLQEHLAQIETWSSEYQGQEGVALEALSSLQFTHEKAGPAVREGSSSICAALEDTRTTTVEINESLKKNAAEFEQALTSTNIAGYEEARSILDSIDRLCDELKCIKDETKKDEEQYGTQQAKREQTLVQDMRDRLGVINKDFTEMVEEHWLHPQKSGDTPAKKRRNIAEDDQIPTVPKKEAILKEKGYEEETPKKSRSRTRESLLEVQNVFLSPDTLAAKRKARLEDISEESSVTGSRYERSRSDAENAQN
ncbi:unnamed protein product [Cylicocyclus nassatus]|uniref:Kinesin-like protein n=1 Tax=Cylicocyclus nassatus TaxID=53992 RepID=A0AA36MAT9_CYLNA|nr:unnamed protein product [Cylicocyclus nassatus]